jgi:hypothetical protein
MILVRFLGFEVPARTRRKFGRSFKSTALEGCWGGHANTSSKLMTKRPLRPATLNLATFLRRDCAFIDAVRMGTSNPPHWAPLIRSAHQRPPRALANFEAGTRARIAHPCILLPAIFRVAVAIGLSGKHALFPILIGPIRDSGADHAIAATQAAGVRPYALLNRLDMWL